MTDPGAEASREAIAAERLRSIRFVGLFRFVGISIAGALNLRCPSSSPPCRPTRPTSASPRPTG